MKKFAVMDLCMCAACIALHIILELFCTIRIGNDLKITLAALPILVIAFLCGPLEGFLTGLIGTFLSQLLTYGITITTPFWIIPYAVQGLLAGLLLRAFKNRINIKSMAVSVFVSGLASVVLTWIASYLDGVVFFKYFTMEIMIGLIPLRLATWVGISIVYTLITIPLTKALIRSCPAGIKYNNKKKIDNNAKIQEETANE